MKVQEIQGSFGIESLVLTERPTPTPGPRQVLVRVRAVSLNYRDLMVVKGIYDPTMPLPRIPMSDGAGEVVAVGTDVTRFKPGDRVAGIFMQSWLAGGMTEADKASALGGAIDGMFAEYVALDETGLVAIPDGLSFEEAATLPCAAVTSWNALFETGDLRAGDTVLVQGTGGVAIFALQFAKAAGARVIITSSSDEKLARAAALGADALINYKKTPNWSDAVLDLTGGRGVDFVIENGGPGTLNQSFAAVRVGGTVSLIGVLTGFAGDIQTAAILRNHIRVQGIFVGSRAMFENMNRAIAHNKIRPVIDRVFPLEQAREAFRAMEAAGHFGKLVVAL